MMDQYRGRCDRSEINRKNYVAVLVVVELHIVDNLIFFRSRQFFNKKSFHQAHEFYEKHGGVTIIAARFMPFLRTFLPFVAGVSEMSRSKFTAFNVLGAAIWVGGITTVGYLFGNVPWVKAHLDKIIWAMILIPGVIVIAGALRARFKAGKSSAA